MLHKKKFYQGVFLAVLGIVLFSAKAVLVKMAYKYDISSEHLLLFRMLFSLPFYFIIILFAKTKTKEELVRKDYLWIVFFGFVGYYLASYFDFLGLQYIKAGLERIILFVYPTLVLILSWIFFKKTITYKQVLAIIVSYLGILVTFWEELTIDMNNVSLGAFLVFLSALTYAIYLVGSGWLIPKFGTVLFTSYAMIVSSLCIIVQYLIFDRQSIVDYSIEVYLIAFIMAIFSTLIPSYLVSAAIARLGASNFSIIAGLGPFSTIFLAYLFLGEYLTISQVLGSTLVIIAIYVVSKTGK